ncbi:hypothetical protein [Cerasicoccus fimbriatus]|uniref:hypothetical protein n=1 Tax=Cerasicoccus fimbriatus TaxID=3014554 RepID=UPI0022B4813F|nr:hypothetical protein [Cerasicoccus sp. TK19100]
MKNERPPCISALTNQVPSMLLMTMIKRIILLLLTAAALLVAGSGCSSTDTDEHGVVRDGGWF